MTEANDIRIVIEALNNLSERVIKQVTLDCVANLGTAPPLGTPIDTGWARNNWIPRIGQAQNAAVGDPENVGAATSAQQQGIAQVLTQYSLSKGKVFISNNVPYITSLNAGSSKQSPSGFVEAAIIRALNGLGRLSTRRT